MLRFASPFAQPFQSLPRANLVLGQTGFFAIVLRHAAMKPTAMPGMDSSGNSGPKTPPIPIAAPMSRPGLLGGPKSITAG